MPKIGSFEENHMKYEAWFENNSYVYLSELEAVRHFIPDGKEGLEIGIGSGRFAGPLGIKTGIEPSAKMRAIAEGRGLKVYGGVAESLPCADSSYDYVLMVTTICFLDDVNKSFLEVKRVLKKSGLFIIGFVDKSSPLGQVYEMHKEKNVFYREAKFYSVDDILSFLNANDFAQIEIVQTVFGELTKIAEIQTYKEGHGEGGFVVLKAVNNK